MHIIKVRYFILQAYLKAAPANATLTATHQTTGLLAFMMF
jgi:hypothetical protein